MVNGIVVLVGDLPIQHLPVSDLAAEFGLTLKKVDTLGDLDDLDPDCEPASVVFSPALLNLDWREALTSVRLALPRALPILCQAFGDDLNWPQAADAGAFHSLLMPFSASEVRQSLGFVWSAKRGSRIMPMPSGRFRPEPFGSKTKSRQVRAVVA